MVLKKTCCTDKAKQFHAESNRDEKQHAKFEHITCLVLELAVASGMDDFMTRLPTVHMIPGCDQIKLKMQNSGKGSFTILMH